MSAHFWNVILHSLSVMHECKACSISFDKYVPHSLIHFVVTWTGATQIVLIFSVRRLLAYSISPWMTPWKRLPYKLTGPLEQPKQNLSHLCHWCGFVAGMGLIIIIMISFQTEHRTIFFVPKNRISFAQSCQSQCPQCNMSTSHLHNPVHNSHTCRDNQEWHARMGTSY